MSAWNSYGDMAVADNEKFFTQQEAAELANISYDTIRRHRKAGKFPNARQRAGDANGTWEIPFGDLVSVGLCSSSNEPEVNDHLGRTRVERELRDTRDQLIRAQARIESLEAIVKQQNDEVEFLRKLVRATSFGEAA